VEQPFRALWTSVVELGDPGAVEQFTSPQLSGVTATYTYDPDTREFVMDVRGTTEDGAATVTFQATGHVNEGGNEINDGTFVGTITVGTQDPVTLSGTFEAEKCDGSCPEPKTIEGWWDIEWTLTQPETMAGTKWHTAIYFDNAGGVQEFESGDLEQASVSYTLDQSGNFSMQITASTKLSQAVSLSASCTLNEQYTGMQNGQFQGTIVIVRDEKTVAGTFTGSKCVNGPCNPAW
jgi:hypothetical protein